MLEADGAPPANILAEALDRFYIHGVDARITFDAGPGPAKAMIFYVNGTEARAVRK